MTERKYTNTARCIPDFCKQKFCRDMDLVKSGFWSSSDGWTDGNKCLNETIPMSHLRRVNGVQNSPNKFDLALCDLEPRDLDLGPPFQTLG